MRLSYALALAIGLYGTADAAPQSPPHANTHRAAPKECMERLHRHDDLPAASRQARDALIANPARIDLVVAAASTADEQRRAEIELGVLRAAEWLKCLDPSGYQALAAYMIAHAADPVMVDLNKALNAQASAPGAATASTNTGGSPTGAAAPAPSFSAAVDIVSPSH